MIKVLLFDFSRTLLFPKDENYNGGLNDLYNREKLNPDFAFFEHFKLNDDLLEFLKILKDNNRLCIFTSATIQEDAAVVPLLKKIFETIYSAKEIGISKKDVKSYKFIAKDLKVDISEILFIDDSMENILVAKKAGMKVVKFVDNVTLFSFLNDII